MDKPIVFISHITEEKEMAIALKEMIEESFPGLMEIFVSSDDKSLPMGSRWLDSVTEALEKCSVELILCSPQSVKQPWINFEAGAGWVKNIPVIPLCHSGMESEKLPVPLNLLTAAKIDDVSSMKLIFLFLAGAIGAKVPKTIFDDFIAKMKELEKEYTFWDTINHELQVLDSEFNIIFRALIDGDISISFQETRIVKLEESVEMLVKEGYLSIERTGAGGLGECGMQYEIYISTSDKYKNLFNQEQCIYYKKN